MLIVLIKFLRNLYFMFENIFFFPTYDMTKQTPEFCPKKKKKKKNKLPNWLLNYTTKYFD